MNLQKRTLKGEKQMSDAVASLAARKDAASRPENGSSRSPWASRPPDHDGNEEPTTGGAVAAEASARARLPWVAAGVVMYPRIDPDGWLAALLHGLGILAALILLSGAVLMAFGEI